jgi:hypothetical protein
MTTTVARRAGITFETWRPPVPSPLPRMDVAAFVGLAASGPLDVPVAVESSAEFHEIFGDDLRLGIARDGNEIIYAELAPAVRQFFRAGGQRCWVVRVASGAVTNRFPLPGVLAVDDQSALTAAHMVARSPGAWSDPLELNCTLRARPVGVRWDPAATADKPLIGVAPVAGGELLRLTAMARRSLVGFVQVPLDENTRRRGPAAADVTIDLTTARWFRRERRSLTTDWSSADAHLLTTTPDGATAEEPMWDARYRRLPGALVVDAAGPAAVLLRPGAWVRVQRGTIVYYAVVRQITEQRRPQARALVEAVDFWRTVEPATALNSANPPRRIRADVVTLDVMVRNGQATVRDEDRALGDGHPRFLGDVPDDAACYGSDRVEAGGARRFPLASAYAKARAPKDTTPVRPGLLLPLGVPMLPRHEWFQARIPTTESALERDGVAVFEAGLFFDHDLADVPAARLLDHAFRIQYLEHRGSEPRRLRGMHALLAVAEPSMIAVPDAVHRPALPRLPLSGWLGVPRNVRIEASTDSEAVVAWDGPRGATSFRVERTLDPRFTKDVVELPGGTFVFDPAGTPTRYFFRVQPRSANGRIGPWSETVWMTLPRRDFLACADDQPTAPVLRLRDAGDTLELRWTQPAGAVADTFELQASQDPSFAGGGTTLYRGPAQRYKVWDLATPLAALRQTGRLQGEVSVPDLFFRVTASVDGRATPWSNSVRHRGIGSLSPRARSMGGGPAQEATELLAIHVALIRLCAARGDVHAILSLPMTWRAAAVNDHLATLAAKLANTREAAGASDDDDPFGRLLSFGSAWHPWLVARETTDDHAAIFPMAPDGLIAGTIAARTLGGGAWLDPSNQLLPGVLQLTPELNLSELETLSPRLNLLRQIPQGHTTLTAQTLANRPELTELGVRRLLILIRRLVMREGATYAFLPHDASLRRLIQREFERVLGDLFARGALAGNDPEEAYRVVVNDSVNPARAMEEGRLVVELWVAPSHPLAFLMIRLVQMGEELLSVQEA